jgi:FkbM family methyltransferase
MSEKQNGIKCQYRSCLNEENKTSKMLKKIVEKLKSGTLIETIKYRLSPETIAYRREINQWNQVIKGKDFIPYVYDNDINLKLYSDSIFSRIIHKGGFEEEELTYYKKYIKEGYVVLDIGANIGLHVLYASKLVGANGRVYAFEPVKKTYNRLVENIGLNRFKNINHFNLAISDTNGESSITTSLDGFDAWNSMAGTPGVQGKNFVKEVIKTQTLDDFIAQHIGDKKIDLIKIDTEGWEWNVLMGGSNYLKNNSPDLMVEYAAGIMENFDRKLVDVFDKLTEYGYKVYHYNHLKDTFHILQRDEKFEGYNIIASKSNL